MNRLYVVESMPSLTGAAADHRLPLRAREIEGFARAMAAELGVAGVRTPSGLPDDASSRGSPPLARDLQRHRGSGIVIAGDEQPPFVHALAHAMNHRLGQHRADRVLHRPGRGAPGRPDRRRCVSWSSDMGAGRVEVLLILGGNPVLHARRPIWSLSDTCRSVPLRVHLGLYQDETAVQCHWHVPEAHYLESWGDARAFDGTVSIIQPLIAPLYGGRSAYELLAAFVGEAERPGYEIVRAYWREHWPRGAGTGDFEPIGKRPCTMASLPARRSAEAIAVTARGAGQTGREPAPPGPARAGNRLRPDPTVHDGRFANNGWLQELPKPLTKLTWDNAAFISPATAQKLGLTQTFGDRGGEHGQASWT